MSHHESSLSQRGHEDRDLQAENAQLLKDRDVWQHKFEESQRQLREQTDALLSLVRRLAERLERCEPEIGWTEKDEQMLAEADAATEGKL